MKFFAILKMCCTFVASNIIIEVSRIAHYIHRWAFLFLAHIIKAVLYPRDAFVMEASSSLRCVFDNGKGNTVFSLPAINTFRVMSNTQCSNAGVMSASELSCARLNEVLLRKPKLVKRLKIHFYTSEVKLQGFSQKHVVQSRAATFDEAVDLFLQKVLLTV